MLDDPLGEESKKAAEPSSKVELQVVEQLASDTSRMTSQNVNNVGNQPIPALPDVSK